MSLEDKIKNAEETMWPMTMGMTTKKAMEQLLDIMDSMPDDACGDWRSSIAYAIDTMRKYQKIEEIMHKVYISDNADVCLVQRLAEIREVIEDGTNQ